MPAGAGANDANGVYLLGEADLVVAPDITTVLNKPAASISSVLGKLLSRVDANKTSVQALTSSAAGVSAYDVTTRAALPGIWDPVAGTFKATAACTIKARGTVGFAANAATTTSRAAYIQKAPAASPGSWSTTPGGIGYTTSSSTASNVQVPVSDTVPLAAGDLIRLAASSGTNLNLIAASLELSLAF